MRKRLTPLLLKLSRNYIHMKPQTLYYGIEPYQLIRASDMVIGQAEINLPSKEVSKNIFYVHANSLEYGNLYVPTLFVEGIEEERIKFDFYKAYKNMEEVVLHCEYRSIAGDYKLIVHTE